MIQGVPPIVRDGSCYAIFAFDVGREVDVAAVARALGAEPAPPAGAGRPPYLQFARPPVRCVIRAAPVDLGDTGGRRTDPDVSLVLYDFGAAAVVFAIPATGSLADLARLGAALSATDALAVAARTIVADAVKRLGDAIDAPGVADVVEDYLVFHARRVDAQLPVAAWTQAHAADLAAVLRAETGPLSDQEIAQTLAAPASFTPDDLVLVDWNAALIVRERADDLLAVLTFANVQLLEMRFLDARLDDDLQRSYESVRHPEARLLATSRSQRGALESVARRQIDAALLFEHVRNAPKLLGDQYLARVYESAARRFRLADWNDALHRKLDVLGTIYERLRDRTAIRRTEVLEWIVILLIFVSIVLPFVVPMGK